MSENPSHKSTPTTPGAEHVLRRVGWRINLGVYLTRCAVPVAGVIIAFGMAYLFAQMLAPAYAPWTFLVLGAVPAILGWVWVACRRDGVFFDEHDLVELTDHLSASDGLASTAYERPELVGGRNTWDAVGSHLDMRSLRLSPSWFAWRVMPALLFSGAVFFVPPRKPPPTGNDNVMVALTQPLAEKLKMTADVLPEPEKKKLEQQLEQVQAAPEGVSREKWEAVEDMQQQLENALAQSEASAYQLSSSMNQLAGMVSQQESKAPNINNAQLQSEIDAMAASILDQLQKNKVPLSQELQDQLKKAMSQCKGGNCNSGKLSDLLKECQSLSDKLAKKRGGGSATGRGGIDRGRGDAALVFGAERTINAQFDEKQLENQFFQASDLTDIGLTPMEPKADPGMFKPGTVKNFGPQQGTNISRTQISPGQRGVVSRYFE